MSPGNLSTYADELKSLLELRYPPLQISYLDEVPSGIRVSSKSLPSSCSFWPLGFSGSFAAPIDAHTNCEIGYYVLGGETRGERDLKLKDKMEWMISEGYLSPGEDASISKMKRMPRFIYYGRLGENELRPDILILFLKPESAMMAFEALSGGSMHPSPLRVLGRPTCSIAPYLLNSGEKAAISLGCAGFRVYVPEAEGMLMLAVRGEALEDFVSSLRSICRANERVAEENRAKLQC